MDLTYEGTKEGSNIPSRQPTNEPGGSMSCPMCGAGKSKSPTEERMSKGPKAMMQKIPVMCMAFMVVTTALLGVAVIGRTNETGLLATYRRLPEGNG